MKRPFLAILGAAALLSGCATVLTPSRCERALSGLQTASDIIAVLQSRGVAAEIATKIADALLFSQITLATACASIPPPPVAVP